MVAKGSMPSLAVSSTGRRIEWLSSSIRQDEAEPGADAAEHAGRRDQLAVAGSTGLLGTFGCSISEKRSPFDSTSMRSPTWAWPTLATAALYWFCRLVELALEPVEHLLVGRRRLDRLVEVVEGLLDRRLVVGDELQLRVDRRELDVELGERAAPAGRRGRAPCAPARWSSTSLLQRGELALQHADPRARRGVDRALLHQLVLQRSAAASSSGLSAPVAGERPVRSNTQTTVARWFLRSDSSRCEVEQPLLLAGAAGCAGRPGCRAAPSKFSVLNLVIFFALLVERGRRAGRPRPGRTPACRWRGRCGA